MKTVLERLADKFTVGDGCWEWTAHKFPTGYGMINLDYRTNDVRYGHRVVYELMVGPIPPDMELDHLCRNRGCVRPDHLEAVSHKVNVNRGMSVAATLARAASRTHCKYDHELTPENTYTWRNSRQCRTCRAAANLRAQERGRG